MNLSRRFFTVNESKRQRETGTEEVECSLEQSAHASAARPAQAYVSAKRLFCHGLKAVASSGSLLLQMLANGDQLVIADALLEPHPAGFGAYLWRISQRDEAGVGSHQ